MTTIDYAALQERLPNQRVPFDTGSSILGNDANFVSVIEPAHLRTPVPDRAMAAIGVVVGNGSITSLRPELPVDAVVMLDAYPPVHDWQRYSDAALAACPTPRAYLDCVTKDDHLPRLGLADKRSIEALLADERHVLGSYHFLSSEYRYTACRAAALAKPVLHATVDITDQAAMSGMGTAFTEANAQVTFLHTTNVAEYVAEELEAYQGSLKSLPIHPSAFIIWSSGVRIEEDGPAITAPTARWSIGLNSYLRESEALLAPLRHFRSAVMPNIWASCDRLLASQPPSAQTPFSRPSP